MFETMSFPCCSGPNDYVFVNFVDHGAPGIVAFPDDQVTELIELVLSIHCNNNCNTISYS